MKQPNPPKRGRRLITDEAYRKRTYSISLTSPQLAELDRQAGPEGRGVYLIRVLNLNQQTS